MKSWVSGRCLGAAILATFLFFLSSTVFATVGRTVGTFAVGPDGAAIYAIPIWAPPGPQGVQPSMALIYDSHGGDGPEGVGWTLAGLSSIARCNLTVAQDGTPAGITLTYADRFCIDGKRLRLTSSENLATYGEDGTTYQTEVADFSNVTAHGTAGNGPDYFTVQGRNGWTYEYGHTTDSLILGNGTAFAWMLDKVTDRDGNAMLITWELASANLAGTTVPESIQWTPSSHGSSTYNYKMEFNYQTLPLAVKAGYLAGQSVENFYSLTSIQIESSGSTVKDYFLSYTPSSTTGRQTLTKLTECADSAQSNCLAPTTFAYQPGGAGLQGATTLTSSSSAIGTPVAVYDFDGDGRNDLAWYQNGTWQVAFATSSGYSAPINSGVTDANALKDSVDGSGTDGFLAQKSGTWWWYKWNGSTFVGMNTNIAIDTSVPGSSALADVDGDGLPDLITRHSDGYLYVRLNTSTAGSVTFSSSPIKTIANTAQPISSGVGTRRADFSGTGRQDIFLTTFTKQGPFIEALQFTGTTFVNTQEFFGSPGDVADYNDDACSDLLLPTVLVLSACNGSPAQTIPLSQSAVAGLDWDGDGRRDVLVNNGGTLEVYLSIGTGLSTTLISTGISYSSTSTYTVAHNATGDGLDALVVTSGSAPYTIQYYLHKGPGQQADLLNLVTDGYGNTITPTYTSIVQGAYSNYSISPAYPYELNLAPIYVVSNVTFSDPTTPPNGTYSQSYSYTGSWKNMQGRGFSNFINVDMHDSRNNVWQRECFENKFPFSGMQACTRLTLDQARTQVFRDQFGNHAENILDGTQNNQRYLIYYNWTDQKYQLSWSEISGNTTGPLIETDQTNYQYDDFGNQTSVIVARTDNDSNSPYLNDTWTTTVSNTFEAPDTSTWCVDLLSASQVSYTASDGSPAVTINRQYTPDTAPSCRYEQISTQPSTVYQVAEVLAYDAFGNIKSDTLTGSGMAARETQTNWGTTGQFPSTVTNALNQVTTFNYNFSFGLVSSEQDPNGLITSWQYGDGFGRLTQEGRPDKTYTTFSYNDCVNWDGCPLSSHTLALSHTVHNQDGSTQSVGTVWEDALGRPILSNQSLLASGTYDRQEVRYDALGNVLKSAFPCVFSAVGTPCPYWTSFMYDALNRVTKSQRPKSASDSELVGKDYEYAGRSTTITDEDGNARTIVSDVIGNERQAEDATGYTITLGYDAAGGHTSTTDSLGNTLWNGTVQYGIAPFTVTATDADLGSWTYTFDALGELTAWKDANRQSFSETYDALSRPKTRSEPDFFTQWTWGTSAANHNIGQLASVCTGTGSKPTSCTPASGYAENEGYDGAGRLSLRTVAIPGDASYTYTWQYDANTGLLDTLTYPTSTAGYALTLSYAYSSGLLQSITDTTDSPNVTLWTADSANARGQFLHETLGNGVVVNHAFDDVTGLPASITAGVGSGDALQDNSYLFDAVGNLTQREDLITGVTETAYPDSLNRLSHTVGDTSTQLTYDSMGRVATWEAYANSTNTKDYTTAQPGCTYYANSQPHAVRSNTQGSFPPSSFCYDANGNMTTVSSSGTLDNSYSWMSFNQPNTLTAPTYNSSSQFFYDANHQRYEQIASYSGSPETTEYIGGLMEKMTNATGTAYRYYVPAGNNLIVYNRWVSGGTTGIDYVTKDPINSSAVVTDHTGTSVVSEKFAALGWNENTSADEAKIANVSRHEFTGQEVLANAGIWLVNMNGRLYQSSGGMFLSPDPNIPDPSRTADYNRYAYVDDNPLTFWDPTGFCGVTQNDDGTVSVDICALPPIPDLCVGCFTSPGNWPGIPYRYPYPYHPPARPKPPIVPPPQTIPCSAANSSGKGLTVQLGYTAAHSSFGIAVPDASHTFVIVTDPTTGASYASRGGPGSGPGGGPGVGWDQITAVSGSYNSGFPDYGSVTATQTVGSLNVPYSSAVSYMNAFAATTGANSLSYEAVTQNSNSYSAALLAGMGFTPPTPIKNAPGYGSNVPSPQMECTK